MNGPIGLDTSDSDAAGAAGRSRARPHWLLGTGPSLGLLVLVSFVFNWPYLTCGFQGEDYIFVRMLREDPEAYSRLRGLWSTWDHPALTSIWWVEGLNDDVGGFWRPVPSLLIEGSVRLLGAHAFPLHLLSIVVHGLVGGTLFLLVRKITGHALLALLAGLFFLSCEDHTMGVGWISTGTDLVCVLFVNLSLLGYALWLETRRPWALAASLVALVPALLSKESAVAAPLVLVCMRLLLPRGVDRELPMASASSLWVRAVGFLRDWLSWAPAMIVLAAYLALYKLLGFGGLSSGLYVDPLAHPVRYVGHLMQHLPVMWLGTLSPVPPYLSMFWPETIGPLAVAGAVAFVLWVAGLWSMRRSAVAVWAMVLYLLALLPQMSTDASERGLYFPTIGASILLALLLMQIGPIARRVAPAVPRAPRLTRVVGWAVLASVLAPGIVLSAAMPYMFAPSFEKPAAQAGSIFPHVEARNPDHLLVLNTPGTFHTFYLHPIVQFYAKPDLDIRVLSSVNGVMTVERIDDRSFVLRADRAGWLSAMFAKILRSSKRPKPGRVFEKGLFKATFVEMTRDGRDILAVRFDMDRPLNDPGLLFMQWDGEMFRPIDLAGLPAGERITLADTSDVWASMW